MFLTIYRSSVYVVRSVNAGEFNSSPSDDETWVGPLDKVDELVVVLADEVLAVVAGDVVPDHAVSVEVVQHGQAGLVSFTL